MSDLFKKWNEKQAEKVEEAKKELLEEENQKSDLDAVKEVMDNPPELVETLKKLANEEDEGHLPPAQRKNYKSPPRNAK